MAASYRTDVILAPAAQVAHPDKIDELNGIPEKDGPGQPLDRRTRSITSNVVEVPVTGVDPAVIRDALGRADQGRGMLPGTGLAYQYVAGTVEDNAKRRELFQAAGKKSGHGTIAWLSAAPFEMPARPPVSGSGHPVIALLDSGVLDHEWLRDDGQMSFLIGPPDQPSPEVDGDAEEFGSHRGHGTFMAGLIRLAAPHARVLSVKVMDDHGRVEEGRLVTELDNLAGHFETQRIDVVCMAFGRRRVGTETFDPVLDALKRLIEKGVKVVASAGNDGSDIPVYPAAYAAGLRDVVSVGAGTTPTERAPFSNYGPWVREWRNGTNVVSVMPLMPTAGGQFVEGLNYAWWSGTSFAAGTFAGELAGAP
jgi:Subtilase family